MVNVNVDVSLDLVLVGWHQENTEQLKKKANGISETHEGMYAFPNNIVSILEHQYYHNTVLLGTGNFISWKTVLI